MTTKILPFLISIKQFTSCSLISEFHSSSAFSILITSAFHFNIIESIFCFICDNFLLISVKREVFSHLNFHDEK